MLNQGSVLLSTVVWIRSHWWLTYRIHIETYNDTNLLQVSLYYRLRSTSIIRASFIFYGK